MKKVVLQFDDVLKLVEFVSITKHHNVHTDIDKCIVMGELPESAIELAINGYNARIDEA